MTSGSKGADGILLLDDEFDIMSVFTQALREQGFLAVGFTEPLLALDDFHTNSDRYGLDRELGLMHYNLGIECH